MIEKLKIIDKEIFLYINSHHSPVLDTVMWLISDKFVWIPFYAFLLFFMIKKYKKNWWLLLIFIALTVTLTDQISVMIKNAVMRYRPCHNLDLQTIVHIVKNHCGGQYGFVSSHAANSFGISAFSLLIMKKRVWAFLFLWATLIAYSRIYLGVHYPSDVTCGAILGIILGIVTAKIFLIFANKKT